MSNNLYDEYKQKYPLQVSVIVTHKHNKPAIELRRTTNKIELIKAIVAAGFKEQPVYILPVFRDKIQSIQTLQDKGIIYREKDKYHFTI